MEQQGNERRQFTRVRVAVAARLESGEHMVVASGSTANLSLNGLYVACDTTPPLGARCRVVLFLEGSDREICIEAGGRVARIDSGGTAINFTDISLESFEHLRALIRRSAAEGQGEQIELEFGDAVGLAPRAVS